VTARPRPEFLSPYHASAFADAAVVGAYRHRPPYPAEAIAVIRDLMVTPRVVLDVGCGSGELARPIAAFAERVDALDPSDEMLARGRQLAKHAPHIRWIAGRAEEAPLNGPYGLIVAGASIHWIDWEIVLPRLAAVLAPGGRLVIANMDLTANWWPGMTALVREFSIYTDWHPIDMIDELSGRDLFALEGRHHTAPAESVQTVDDFVAGLFSHASLARVRLGADRADAFARAVREMLRRNRVDPVRLGVIADVAWGRPLRGPR
jgi:SAM-dependent methyltransferase